MRINIWLEEGKKYIPGLKLNVKICFDEVNVSLPVIGTLFSEEHFLLLRHIRYIVSSVWQEGQEGFNGYGWGSKDCGGFEKSIALYAGGGASSASESLASS